MDSVKELTLLDAKKRFQEQWVRAPITTTQIGLGITMHALNVVGVVPFSSVLFHPQLAFYPRWETYRTLTSFLVLGRSAADVVYRSVAMYYLHSPLEEFVDGNYPAVQNMRRDVSEAQESFHSMYDQAQTQLSQLRTLWAGKEPSRIEQVRQEAVIVLRAVKRAVIRGVKNLYGSTYLRAVLLSCAFLVATELFFFRDSADFADVNSSFGSQAHHRFLSKLRERYKVLHPQSLFPGLDYALRWMWAFSGASDVVTLFGVLPMRPVYVPLVLCGASGFATWREMLKGLACSLAVSGVLGLRRPDGEPVLGWTLRLGRSWAVLLQAKVREYILTLRRIALALASSSSSK